jgi:lactoylglutathione lyase
MKGGTRYAHTNLVARDWRRLAAFYVEVFACRCKPPERDLKGPWLDRLASLRGAHIAGIHLQLPGYGKDGPTLEVFQYLPTRRGRPRGVNAPGFAHIAFAVHNVKRMAERVQRCGGSMVGEVVSARIRGAGALDVAYARDPEGNIIELQKWG